METNIDIQEKNYYFLICDAPAIDAKHRIDQLNHMGFIADGNKENMVNYFQRFSKSKEPVVFIFQNKIRNLSAYMDQPEFDKLGIKQSFEQIPRLRLSELMKQQFEDMEFIGYNSLELLPDYRKTVGVCREAIRIDPYNIRHIPDYMLSKDTIDSCVCIEGNTLQYIPQERLNAGICLKAVENDYMALQYVPFKFKSEELCRMAVKGAVDDTKNESYHVLAHIPYTFICNEVIRQFNKMSVSGEAMAKTIVNKEVMSAGMCDKLFEWDHNAYKHFPNLYKSKEMTEKAIALDGILLAYAPPKQINEELCLSAIKNTYKAMAVVPVFLKNPDFCLKAVLANRNAGIKNLVPMEIKNGKNIYSFNERLEKILTGKVNLTFEQVRNLYSGGSQTFLEVKSGSKIYSNSSLFYDKELNRFLIAPTQSGNINQVLTKDDLNRKKGRRI
ncbi:hypothetical protein [Dysgonomonas termitidis]|uniref:Uncharacterized protein n=1 Tax=Dysgonomonas termitidis TaxID=1516126 RepID=A0ABV9KYU0_9BACT